MLARRHQRASGAPVSQKNGLVKRQSVAVMFLHNQTQIGRTQRLTREFAATTQLHKGVGAYGTAGAQHSRLPSQSVFQGIGLSHNYQPPFIWLF